MKSSSLRVAVLGATGNTGKVVVAGLRTSVYGFEITSLTRETSIHSETNQKFLASGIHIVGYPDKASAEILADLLQGVDVFISCIAWQHLEEQKPWIDASKVAGIRRFVPSEWVTPAPRGVIDIKDRKLEILGYIQRQGVPYTLIDTGCWYQVWVPKVPSGRSDHAHMIYIDHRIVGDGKQKFALTDMNDIGKYVAQIIADDNTINKRVFCYTEVLSMSEIWDTMERASGETPPRETLNTTELKEIINACGERLSASDKDWHHPDNIMDTANFNMGQYRLSWCIRGDDTPEYADYLGYLDFWKLYPDYPAGTKLIEYYQDVLGVKQ